MSNQDGLGWKSLDGSVASLDTSMSGLQRRHSDVTPFSFSPDKVSTVRPIAGVGQSTVVSPRKMQTSSPVLQNHPVQAQNSVVQNSMVQNALGCPQRPALQQSKTLTSSPPSSPDVFHAIELRLQVFKCEILNEIQSSLNNYTLLTLHEKSQDIAATSYNELGSLLGSERQMREKGMEADRALHTCQVMDLTINFRKEIEAAVDREREERNTQFEELVKRFGTQSLCVDRKLHSDIFSQESYDNLLLQRDEMTTTTSTDLIATTELIVEPNTARGLLCESNRGISDLEDALQLLSVEYRQKLDGDRAWKTETQCSQENIRAAYSELEGSFLSLRKEFDTRFCTLSEHMMTETSECNLRLDEHHAWNSEIVRSCKELRDWVIDLKDIEKFLRQHNVL